MSKIPSIITIGQAVGSIINSIQYGKEIYDQSVKFMDSMEIKNGLSGTAKKAAVMDKMKEILLGQNEDWERWKLVLSDFIDTIKTTYNQFKALFPKYA